MITVVIENVCKMSVVSFALAVVFIIRQFILVAEMMSLTW